MVGSGMGVVRVKLLVTGPSSAALPPPKTSTATSLTIPSTVCEGNEIVLDDGNPPSR